jgi:hypothetical protein
MLQIVRNRRKSKRRRPQRLLYHSGVTPDELSRLIAEVGREEVEKVLRALDLGPALTPAE